MKPAINGPYTAGLASAPYFLTKTSNKAGAIVYAIVMTKKYALTTLPCYSWGEVFCIMVMAGPTYVLAAVW